MTRLSAISVPPCWLRWKVVPRSACILQARDRAPVDWDVSTGNFELCDSRRASRSPVGDKRDDCCGVSYSRIIFWPEDQTIYCSPGRQLGLQSLQGAANQGSSHIRHPTPIGPKALIRPRETRWLSRIARFRSEFKASMRRARRDQWRSGGEMMGGQNGIAELIWFVRWLEIALGAIKTTAGEDVRRCVV